MEKDNRMCLVGDSAIMLDCGVELISKMSNNDVVMTLNKDLTVQPTSIWKYFQKTEQKILEMTTMTGRKIKCTFDHQLLVLNKKEFSFIPAINLKPLKSSLIIKHMPAYVPTTIIPSAFLDLLSKEYYQGLNNTRKINCISQKEIGICARIVGLLHSGNQIGFKNIDGDFVCILNGATDEDNKKIHLELCGLGFRRIQLSDFHELRLNEMGDKKYVTVWGGDSQFLRILSGMTTNNNFDRVIIPEWILSSDTRIKREFLSGFLSGFQAKEGIMTRITIDNMIDFDTILPQKIVNACKELYFSNKPEQSIIYGFEKKFNQNDSAYIQMKFEALKILFRELNINTSYELDPTNNRILFSFEQTFDNIMGMMNLISLPYSKILDAKLMEDAEYMKYLDYNATKLETTYEIIIRMLQEKKSYQKIVDETNIPEMFIKKFSNFFGSNYISVPKKISIPKKIFRNYIQLFFPKKKFMKEYKLIASDGSTIFSIPIDTMQSHNQYELVCDFETISGTHNFIVNGIVSSNCKQ